MSVPRRHTAAALYPAIVALLVPDSVSLVFEVGGNGVSEIVEAKWVVDANDLDSIKSECTLFKEAYRLFTSVKRGYSFSGHKIHFLDLTDYMDRASLVLSKPCSSAALAREVRVALLPFPKAPDSVYKAMTFDIENGAYPQLTKVYMDRASAGLWGEFMTCCKNLRAPQVTHFYFEEFVDECIPMLQAAKRIEVLSILDSNGNPRLETVKKKLKVFKLITYSKHLDNLVNVIDFDSIEVLDIRDLWDVKLHNEVVLFAGTSCSLKINKKSYDRLLKLGYKCDNVVDVYGADGIMPGKLNVCRDNFMDIFYHTTYIPLPHQATTAKYAPNLQRINPPTIGSPLSIATDSLEDLKYVHVTVPIFEGESVHAVSKLRITMQQEE
jgi:hypothetical protein